MTDIQLIEKEENTEEQTLRSEYRLQFLTLMRKLQGKKIEAETVEGNTVTCEYEAISRSCDELAVSQLNTPAGLVKRAIIRLPDFHSLRFQSDDQ